MENKKRIELREESNKWIADIEKNQKIVISGKTKMDSAEFLLDVTVSVEILQIKNKKETVKVRRFPMMNEMGEELDRETKNGREIPFYVVGKRVKIPEEICQESTLNHKRVWKGLHDERMELLNIELGGRKIDLTKCSSATLYTMFNGAILLQIR